MTNLGLINEQCGPDGKQIPVWKAPDYRQSVTQLELSRLSGTCWPLSNTRNFAVFPYFGHEEKAL